MTIGAVNNAQVIIGSFDASNFTGNIAETPGSVAVYEVPAFGFGGFQRRITGIKSGMVNLDGYTDHAATGIANALALGTQYGLAIGPTAQTPTYGDPVLMTTGKLTRWAPFTASTDAPAKFAAEFAVDAPFMTGKVGAPLASRTTSGLTGTAVAMTGPTASQKVYGLLCVTAAAGTNLAVKIQSDDNSGFTSPTDRITFSTVSATGWQWGTPVAGDLSTETYWRVVATIASSTFSFACFFGVI